MSVICSLAHAAGPDRIAADHGGDLPFRGLRRRLELSAKIHRERVREDVLLPGLDAVEDRERHVARRGLRQRELTDHVGVDGARVDAEDRGALRPEEDARGLGQRMERGLRGAVGREERDVGQAGRRADVDDRPAAVPGQRRRQALEQLQRPEVVHLHLAPRLVEDVRIRDSRGQQQAGVVEDELDVRRRFCGRADLVRVGHVEPQRHEPLVTQVAQRLRIARRRVDLLHAPGQERLRQRSPDAAVGARHQGDRSFDSLCVHRLFLSCWVDRSRRAPRELRDDEIILATGIERWE